MVRGWLRAAALAVALFSGSTTPLTAQDIAAPALSEGSEIRFGDGDHLLAGHLLLPAGEGPHPAVVMIEGSGPASYRDGWDTGGYSLWRDVSRELLKRGYAVLLFDKPGVHESTGNWRMQTLRDRAREVVAAVEFLQSRREIDGTRVGVIGHSQGGYVAPIAALEAGDRIAFVVSLAGPAVPVRQQIVDDMTRSWKCAGNRDLSVHAKTIGLRAWLATLSLVSRVAQPSYLARVVRHDPADYAPRVTQPMLVLLAGNDPLVEVRENERRWRQWARARDNIHVRIVPDIDHFFRTSPLCGPPVSRSALDGRFWEALFDGEFWQTVDVARSDP